MVASVRELRPLTALRSWLAASTHRRAGTAAATVLLAAGLALGLVFVTATEPARPRAGSATAPPPSTASQPPRPARRERCPLTGVARTGNVPARPALAVKIGNEPYGARPQSGLNEADVVFDTPAEGFIMRYIAVFQCTDAAEIGPVRSLRWVDWHIVRQFIHPILAFAGGIEPDVAAATAMRWLLAANLLEAAQAAGVRISSRLPPDNLYTSTASLYGLFRQDRTPPRPIFTYSVRLPPGARPAKALSIDFSAGTDVTWRWEPSQHAWLHTYAGVPDVDALTGRPVEATNVVVQIVRYRFGPYAESPGGSGDVESQTIGRGVGYVLRDGTVTKVTWYRRFLVDPTTFIGPGGRLVDLAPGRTWVELVPDTTAAAPGALVITR